MIYEETRFPLYLAKETTQNLNKRRNASIHHLRLDRSFRRKNRVDNRSDQDTEKNIVVMATNLNNSCHHHLTDA